MVDLIRKVLDCEVKKLGERSYEFTASTSAEDRDGEVIEAKGWDLKNFKKNPVIMYAHDYRSLPIGRAPRVWISGDKLKNTVEFPPEGTYEFADIVERLLSTGYLKAESVGFMPKKWEDGDGKEAPYRTYKKQELLEISIVPVPAHQDALLDAVKEGVITTKELETLSTKDEDIVNKPEGKDRGAVTQSGVKDEIDFLKGLIGDAGLDSEAMEEAWELVRQIMRLAGDDIPDDIRDEIGVIITTEQELKTRDAIDYLEAYLEGAKVDEEPDKPEPELELDEARIGEIIVEAVGEAIGKAQGKI